MKNSFGAAGAGSDQWGEVGAEEEQVVAEEADPMLKIFVGGLPATSTIQSVFDYFSYFGQLVEVDCKMDPLTGRCRGFGFVHFADWGGVEACLQLEVHVIDGKTVEIKPHEKDNSGGGGGGLGSKTLPCKHFQQGRCTFGDECGFSHDESKIADSNANHKTIVCRHWLQGKCNFGEACSFAHGSAGKGVHVNALAAAGIDFGAIARTVQGAVSQAISGGGLKPCRHFALGKCTYGDQCQFTHDPSAGGEQWAQAAAMGLVPGICKFYQQGKCNYGDSCKFPHTAEESGAVAGVAIERTVGGASRYTPY